MLLWTSNANTDNRTYGSVKPGSPISVEEIVVLSTGCPLARTAYFRVFKIGHGYRIEKAAPALLNSCSDAPTREKSVPLQVGVGVGVVEVEDSVEVGVIVCEVEWVYEHVFLSLLSL